MEDVGMKAEMDNENGKCACPLGFKADGVKNCEDVDECKEKKACQCGECIWKNTWGRYDCSCTGDLLYTRDPDTCISKTTGKGKSSWAAMWIILLRLAMAGGGAYLVYKYIWRAAMNLSHHRSSSVNSIPPYHMSTSIPPHSHVASPPSLNHTPLQITSFSLSTSGIGMSLHESQNHLNNNSNTRVTNIIKPLSFLHPLQLQSHLH